MIFNNNIIKIPIHSEPSAPRNLCIIGESEDGIELNWIPPLEPNGDVHYVIYYSKIDEDSSLLPLTSNSSENQPLAIKISSSSTFFNLTGLQRGEAYNITLVAANRRGKSDVVTGFNYRHEQFNESMGEMVQNCQFK